MNFNEALDGDYADWEQYTHERHMVVMDCLYKQWKKEDKLIKTIFGTMIATCIILFFVGLLL